LSEIGVMMGGKWCLFIESCTSLALEDLMNVFKENVENSTESEKEILKRIVCDECFVRIAEKLKNDRNFVKLW
jgi:hypothetical protein